MRWQKRRLGRCDRQRGYRNIYFTRDVAVSIEGLVAVGLEEAVQRHLEGLKARQGKNCGIPDWFIDNWYAWAKQKFHRAVIERELVWMVAKKINRRFPGLIPSMGATHDTTDSELHYINAIHAYAEAVRDHPLVDGYSESMHRALRFAEGRINKDGLYTGVDWRDNVRFPNDVTLLSNNALLFRAYQSLKLDDKAEALKTRIQEKFWNGSYHTDQPGGSHFDAFGQALAVLYEIATPEQYNSIASKFESMFTIFGLRANDLVTPDNLRGGERVSVKRVNQNGKIWPFVEGYAALALKKMGKDDLARRILENWSGFGEWYDPFTGKRGGARLQMWSAALYIRACQELKMAA